MIRIMWSKFTLLIERTTTKCMYVFPDRTRKLSDHALLSAIKSVKQAADIVLRKRGTVRTIRIMLEDNLLEAYTDEHGNLSFKGKILEQADRILVNKDVHIQTDDETPKVKVYRRSLRQTEKELVIEKFNGRNYNAAPWIELFQEECQRIEVEDEQLPDTLRLCLDGLPVYWYITAKKTIRDGPWPMWKKDFLFAFGANGWSNVVEAINFRHLNGSLVEYAFKKHNLLLDSDPELREIAGESDRYWFTHRCTK